MSCSECAGRSLVSPCPLCATDEVAEEMEPIEAGRYARECCHPRESNPWSNPIDLTARLMWFEGWDLADAPDDDTEVLDNLPLAGLAEILAKSTEKAELQFTILKHGLRGGGEADIPLLYGYVRTLRECHAIQTTLKRRCA